MRELPYDKTSKSSIEEYGKKLIGKTFKNVIEEYPYISDEDKEKLYQYYNNPRGKGSLGNLIEEYHFLYPPNSKSEADFNEAGVELKVTPYIINKSLTMKAKERLVLSMIDYEKDYKYTFEENHMYKKCALMLIVYYLYEREKKRLDYVMNYIKLFKFPESDFEIIKEDYKKIMNKIKEGKAHEISEADTIYLGACTKAADSTKIRKQPFSNIPAQPRAYCLKNSFMTYILNNYIAKENDEYEPVIKDSNVLKDKTLEEYVIEKMSKYYGKSVDELKEILNIECDSSVKSFNYLLAKSMLEIENEKIEEFEKANISIKTIRIGKNGIIKEHMSFPAFKYNDIVNQNFEESDLYEEFSSSRFLFIIFKFDKNNKLIFRKAMFWNVPYSDIDGEIKKVWEETKRRIEIGEYNNLPKSTESEIIHVRPHGRNADDVYPTPDGGTSTKKCFWLDRKYIMKQIKSEEF